VDSYTLADLARVTGAKRRSLQLWADAGVIRAKKGTNRAGTGTHRLFSRDEAIIACIIQAFALHQMSIGELQGIGMVLRDVFPELYAEFNALLESAIKGEGDGTLVFESWWIEKDSERHTVVNIFPTTEVELQHVHKPQGFAYAILLRNYLSKLDS
jgi:hypothetical protein